MANKKAVPNPAKHFSLHLELPDHHTLDLSIGTTGAESTSKIVASMQSAHDKTLDFTTTCVIPRPVADILCGMLAKGLTEGKGGHHFSCRLPDGRSMECVSVKKYLIEHTTPVICLELLLNHFLVSPPAPESIHRLNDYRKQRDPAGMVLAWLLLLQPHVFRYWGQTDEMPGLQRAHTELSEFLEGVPKEDQPEVEVFCSRVQRTVDDIGEWCKTGHGNSNPAKEFTAMVERFGGRQKKPASPVAFTERQTEFFWMVCSFLSPSVTLRVRPTMLGLLPQLEFIMAECPDLFARQPSQWRVSRIFEDENAFVADLMNDMTFRTELKAILSDIDAQGPAFMQKVESMRMDRPFQRPNRSVMENTPNTPAATLYKVHEFCEKWRIEGIRGGKPLPMMLRIARDSHERTTISVPSYFETLPEEAIRIFRAVHEVNNRKGIRPRRFIPDRAPIELGVKSAAPDSVEFDSKLQQFITHAQKKSAPLTPKQVYAWITKEWPYFQSQNDNRESTVKKIRRWMSDCKIDSVMSRLQNSRQKIKSIL